ncbi:unnamed protein product [Effrenium voratum]|uniref:Protein kinase domain-containing protein n=1 Tax=Effrenium voratum TaxID=2562239 RepID=A0AA36I1Q1_9DINO|nr:unnamed protein product [Effrenium voratum]
MARRNIIAVALVAAVAVLALRWSSAAFLPSKPMLRAGTMASAGALAASGAMPAMAEEGGLLNFGKVELGGGFALNLDIPETNLINISILIAGLLYFLSPVLGESMASREKEIGSDIEDAIAKYNEATSRLAEAEKNKAQADQVVKEINDSISKDIKEFQTNLQVQAKKTQETQEKAQEKSLEELQARTKERLEAYIDSQAVERGLKELKGLKPGQKQKFMERLDWQQPCGPRKKRSALRARARGEVEGGEPLALKRVTASCPKHFEALANEVTLLRQLKDSPNIIQVLDAEVVPERLLIHIVMEEGEMDLGRLLLSEADMSLGDVQALWRQMLEAVQVVHQERVVHSDLKPGNFLLVDQRLKLIDFGIAKRIASNTTNISRESSVGTISYMAPEAVKQGAVKIGRPSDVWSLGIILYQMVYMRAPFAHLDPMQRLFALTDPNVSVEFPEKHRFENHSPAAKDSLLDVLQRCLQREPSKRPTIPELLEHPFAQDTVRLTRASFDHALEALISGFVGAAEDALASEPQGEGPSAFSWQVLADEVWSRLGDGCTKQGRSAGSFTGLGPFREWLARGVKRQRVAAPAAPAEKTAVPTAPVSAKSAGGAPPATRPNVAAKQKAVARVPLHQINNGNAKSDRPAIHAELLQKQRTCLKKAPGQGRPAPNPGHAGKENLGPSRTAGFGADNLVLKRLKDRRAMLADDKAEEESDSCWR